MTTEYAPEAAPLPALPTFRPPPPVEVQVPADGGRGAPHPVPQRASPRPDPVEDGPDFAVVAQLRGRVATRLTSAQGNYGTLTADAQRQLIRALVVEELNEWVAHEHHRGRPTPSVKTEDDLIAAVVDQLGGLGRLEPLLARADIEDIHFEGSDPVMLRLTDGRLVQGPAIASTDDELLQVIKDLGATHGSGQTSREFDTATPVLNMRLQGVSDLGARLSAQMDVVPRISGTIRVHRLVDVVLDDLYHRGTVSSPLRAFLRAAVRAGASLLISGAPGAGKTVLLRALINEIEWNSVIVTVEDERELGTHLLGRHAVVKSFESRMPNAEGVGEVSMATAMHQALRLSPTHIIVGEVRGGYVMNMLDAVTDGIAGAMCTLHAPSADSVPDRVLMNARKADPPPAQDLVLRSLSTLDLIVHITRDRDWQRYVSDVIEVGPIGDNGLPTRTSIFKAGQDGRAVPVPGSMSEDLTQRLAEVGFDRTWLSPELSDYQVPDPTLGDVTS